MRHAYAFSLCGILLAACGSAAPPSGGSLPDDRAERTGPPARSWRDPQPEAMPPAGQPQGASYALRAAEDRLHAEGRGRDQSTHPEYLALTAPWIAAVVASGGADTRLAHDPYRIAWAGARGRIEDVEFANRYGARLRGRLFAPLGASGPLPAVLFVPGRFAPAANSPFTGFANYENLLQSLAESGYVVLAVGPQGQDGSEYFEPPHVMCEPGGSWTAPQEFGLREPGACAGQEGAPSDFGGEQRAIYQGAYDATGDDRPSHFLQGQLELAAAVEQRADGYAQFETRFVFAALDGVDYLLSDGNPWRGLIDDTRVAIVGHSAGGHASLIVANGDPERRFAAAVTLDGLGFPPDTIASSVPTLVQMAERQNEFGPYDVPPPNHVWPPYRVYRRFVAEHTPAMLVTPRGSTHHEWSYVPHAATNPVSPLQNASSLGGQVGFYYTLAWLDYWLKPQLRHDARRRLMAAEFDESADSSSIGTGTFDVITQRNVPYALAGERVADHLSVLFLSQARFGGVACEDLQAGCP